MKHQQTGFTLIELVMVIVVLGILAAVAIPRFYDMSGDAQAAAANGQKAVVGSAIAIAMARKASGGNYNPPSGTEVAAEVPGAGCQLSGVPAVYINSTNSVFGTPGTIDIQLLNNAGAIIAACGTQTTAQIGTVVYN